MASRTVHAEEDVSSRSADLPQRHRVVSPRPPLAARLPAQESRLPSQPSIPRPSALHILLVEDNIINQKVLSKQLIKEGCQVNIANHGGEAIDFLHRSQYWANRRLDDPGISLNVILMDWEMPVMDGITCSKKIREFEKEGKLSEGLLIVGTTANAREAQINVALDAGMVGAAERLLWLDAKSLLAGYCSYQAVHSSRVAGADRRTHFPYQSRQEHAIGLGRLMPASFQG